MTKLLVLSLLVLPLSSEAAPKAQPTRAQLDHAIDQATAYLERACGPDGRFAYKVDVTSDRESVSYNIVRHAGAIYALAMANRFRPHREAVEAMVRAAAFLRHDYVGAGIRRRQLAVWSRPVKDRSRSGYQVASLGGTGLGLVALAAVRDADINSVPLEDLRELGRFILFLQKKDGGFIHKYRTDTGPVADWESLYYPGEAALGLIALYEADHSRKWLVGAGKALAYLARSRVRLSTVPADHWALVATAEIMPYADQIGPVVSREALVRHSIQVCNSILDGFADPAIASRTAPVATRLEGLLAAAEFLPENDLRDKIDAVASQQANRLLRPQIVSGAYAGGMPASIEDAASVVVRIDFVQHAICAWIRLDALRFSPRQASPLGGGPLKPGFGLSGPVR
jgi:hypothetical protein